MRTLHGTGWQAFVLPPQDRRQSGHPGDKNLVERYVLQDFAKDEWPWVEELCDVIADNAGLLAAGKDASFQNKVHLAMQAKGFGDKEEPSGSE